MNRIELFKQMLADDPTNSVVMFGLAKEYEKVEQYQDVADLLTDYLATTGDEGNAYGMLATAYEKLGQRDAAKQAYLDGIAAASRHGHPSMAADYQMTLDTDYEDD